MRFLHCFFPCWLAAWSLSGQSIVCDTGGFVYNHFVRVTAPSGVNLRKGPNTGAAKLASIPYGTELPADATAELPWETIEEKNAAWQRVCYAGVTGYVFGGFLEELHDRTSIRFVVANAGVDSDWSNLDLDSSAHWTALVPREPRWRDYCEARFESVHLKRVEERHAPSGLSDKTLVFFSGFESGSEDDHYYHPEEPSMLFPGEARLFYVYDPALKRQRAYQLFARGQAVSTASGDGGWPFSAIQNYQIVLREVAPPKPGTSGSGIVVLEQVLFSGNLKFDFDAGSFFGPAPFLAGDFDHDNKLDLILNLPSDKGSVSYLFLSSKALPGFLMRVVAVRSDSCC